MLPTLRLGFLITPPSISRAAQAAKYVTDWNTSLFTQVALASFIEEGDFARHLRRVGAAYQQRHDIIADSLRRDFADHLELLPSNAGLHLTVLAKGATPQEIIAITQKAAERGLAFHPLSMFTIENAPLAGVALGYGAIATDDIEEGLRLLQACF
jgi:GntR family transcriptional regulator/MocR family aminotransferase